MFYGFSRGINRGFSRKTNSVTYDAEKDELKIVTYYTEDYYKSVCVRAVYSRYCRHCFLTKDPVVRRTFSHRWLVLFRRLVLLDNVLATLYALAMLSYNLDYLSAFGLLGYYLMPLLLLWATWWFYPSIFACVASIIATSNVFPKKKAIKPLWLRITYAFSEQKSFRQEVVFQPDGYTWTTPGPDTSVHAPRLESNVRVLLDETNLYLLHFENERKQFPNALHRSLHFVKSNYTPTEWNLLVSKITQYETYLKFRNF